MNVLLVITALQAQDLSGPHVLKGLLTHAKNCPMKNSASRVVLVISVDNLDYQRLRVYVVLDIIVSRAIKIPIHHILTVTLVELVIAAGKVICVREVVLNL